jgi:hypothetical protein
VIIVVFVLELVSMLGLKTLTVEDGGGWRVWQWR